MSGAEASAALDKLTKDRKPEPMIVDSVASISEEVSSSEAATPESQTSTVQDMVGVETVRLLCAHPGAMELEENASKTCDTNAVENENQVNGNVTLEESSDNLTQMDNTTTEKEKTNEELTGSPAKSSCTNVERPSPNCAIFDFKHLDTDTEEPRSAGVQANLNLVDCDPSKNRVYKVRRGSRGTTRRTIFKTEIEFGAEEEVDHEALQQIIDSAILDPDWLNCNMLSDLEFSAGEGGPEEDQVVPNAEKMDTGSEEGSSRQSPQIPHQEGINKDDQQNEHSVAEDCSKESISQLVSGAERLVREPSLTAEDPSPVVSPRAVLQPLPLNGLQASSKQARVRQWLAQQRREVRTALTCVQDSCDASGELTTGESDIDSVASDLEVDVSTATQKGCSTKGSTRGSFKDSKDMTGSCDNTPTTERVAFPTESSAAKVSSSSCSSNLVTNKLFFDWLNISRYSNKYVYLMIIP